MSKLRIKPEYKIVTLNVGSSNRSLFFVPGGPGMNSECFKFFAKTHLKEFTVRGINFTGEGRPTLPSWRANLKTALKRFPSDIVMGHSFGGMLLLSTAGISNLVKGQIILAGAPNMGWRKNVATFRLTKTEKRNMEIAELQFQSTQNLDSLRLLWKSWAPYYFNRKHRIEGSQWLNRQDYTLKAFQATPALLKDFKLPVHSKIPTLFIGGAQDKLTPISAFKSFTSNKDYMFSIKKIPDSGHFCWLDAPERLASELLGFMYSI